MNRSLRTRLYIWLSVSIFSAGLLAAALSFYLSYTEANDLQDAQLRQVAAVLADDDLPDADIDYKPASHEDAEIHYVIKRLGSRPPRPDPKLDLPLPESLPSGLQTIEERGVRWRAIVTQGVSGRRFAVAQRMTVRDEIARDTALLTLVPLLVLIPLLMAIVGVVLRTALAPLRAMSTEVDRLQGDQLAVLDERSVPLEALSLVQAMNRLMRRLALALEQQRRLVSDAAHELRTPVAALIVQADNVQHVGLSPEAGARMALLRQGLERISSLIEQLLNFARVQGTSPVTAQRLQLGALVRTAIEEALPLAQDRGVDLGSVRNDTVTIVGDPLHAYALVRNAIDNAVRYTPAGGAVDVSVANESGVACLVVEDTGPGISDADIERVFDPFVRVLGSQQSGSGLGLAIARNAAQALGGTIRLDKRGDHRTGLRFVYRQRAV